MLEKSSKSNISSGAKHCSMIDPFSSAKKNTGTPANSHNARIVPALLLLAATSLIVVPASSYAQPTAKLNTNSFAQGTFPPPIFYTFSDEPTYTINLQPSSQNSSTQFTPRVVSIPVNTTVIWFNNDIGIHTVQTVVNSTYTPPATIFSRALAPNGGSFMFKFNKVGTYIYYDGQNATDKGIINVGNGMEVGSHMNMLIGGLGVLPFNASNPQSFVTVFVPKDISIPPAVATTYNVTISNSTARLYSHAYDTVSGILYLELVPKPSHGINSTKPIQQQFTTWGPDFVSQEGHGNTGTFHIQGPVMTQNTQYTLKVQIVTKDSSKLSNETDQFALPAFSAGTTSASGSSSGHSTSTYTVLPNPAMTPSKAAPNQMPVGNYTSSNSPSGK
jgi:plastocyanin